MKKKQTWGIILPENEVIELAYFVPSKDGYIFGVPKAESHFTLLDEGSTISTHVTYPLRNEREHLGRIEKEAESDDWIIEAFKPKIIPEEAYGTQIVYITNKWTQLIQNFELIWKTVETRDKTGTYLDLPSTFEQFNNELYDFLKDITEHPETYLGECTVGELKQMSDDTVGILPDSHLILIDEDDLIEIEYSALQDFRNQENPITQVLKPVGFPFILDDIDERLKTSLRKAS